MIGRVERVRLRDVWPHEAYDLTRWLQENLDILNEKLGLNLSSAEREQAAGAFSVDLVAEDESGGAIIIENQMGKSDHDHLGKVMTYLVAVGARAAVWIVEEPRPEHIGVINWLNESSAAGFYLLKIEAIRIGSSPPAPLLTLITGPSEEGREVGQTKKDLAERYGIREEFWTALLERARERTKLHSSISPSREGWISKGAGKSGLVYNYVIHQHAGRVELYIDQGQGSEQENKRVFDALLEHRLEIETAFGEALEWQRLDSKRASRIFRDINVGGYRDHDRWPEIQDAMIDAMVRLEQALRPHIARLGR